MSVRAAQEFVKVGRDFLLCFLAKKKIVVGWLIGREGANSHIIKKGVFWCLPNF